MQKQHKLQCFKFLVTAIATMFCILTATAQTPHTGTNYPAGTPVNYVRTWDATAPETDPNALTTRPLKDVKQATQYFDGLGRPLQTVIKKGSMVTGGQAYDMVSPVEYDEFGREQYKYLPYVAGDNTGNFKTTPFTEQSAFYNNVNGPLKGQGENYYYSQTVFESSPLNRITKAMAPGVSWAGSSRGVEQKYWINTLTDDVKIWNLTNVADAFGTYAISTTSTAGNGRYAAGELYKNVSADEHGKQMIEFKDKEGKVILKKVQLTATADDGTGSNYDGWLCTYYIYDDLGNLRCVIQPEGVKLLALNGWQMNTTLLAEQFFRYEYDQRNRMIKKKVPGAGEVWMVYDARDRLVMTQDANMRIQQKWLYTQYDELNRPVTTGLITDASNYNNLSYHLTAAYSSTAYPNLSNYTSEELTKTFYNDYNWLATYNNPLPATYNSSYNSYFQNTAATTWPYPQVNVQSTLLKGLPTGSRTKVLGTANTYLYFVSFYDDKGRVIQVQSTNNTGGTDIATTQYTWAGQPYTVVQQQQKGGTNPQTHIVTTKMEYDDLGRVLNVKKTVNSTVNNTPVNKPEQTIVQNQYNELGQLKKKILGSNNLESLTYDYNIRGWMLGANRDYAKDGNSTNFFGFDLGYDKTNNGIIGNQSYTAPQYNGNIEGMVWKSKGDGEKRKYDFTYDAANRLMKADFTQYTGGTFNQNAGVNFDVKMGDGNAASNNAYDANGNIKRMQQWGLKINNSTQIDNLLYEYQPGTNKLAKVTDAGIAATDNGKLGDFKDGANSNDDYSYDVNGNMNVDNNKAISSITYNHLNLPQTITVTGKGDITYTYDAAGNKLKKTTLDKTVTPNKTTVTDYVSGLVYENDVLQFLPQEEGRIRFVSPPAGGTSGGRLEYDYMLKDHLGNVRMVLTEEQQQDIYPAATLEPSLVTTEKTFYTIDQAKVVTNSAANYIRNSNQQAQTYVNNNGVLNNNTSCSSTVCTTDNSQYVYKLNSNTNKTGLGITLKVMAGDKIDVLGKSYYFTNNPGTNSTVPVLDILSGFLNAPLAAATVNAHGQVTAAGINTPANLTGITSMVTDQDNQSSTNTTKPRAFINVIFFDEQFKAISYKISMVGSNKELKNHYADLQNLAAPKNGFVYIYCSNETAVDVFFDNVQVVHSKGAILEETHYYPGGLTMAGVSSKGAGSLQNKRKFNKGTELNNDFGVSLYETDCRLFDPQIGRFWQIDELAEADWEWTPYSFANDNPVNFNDPEGLIVAAPGPKKKEEPVYTKGTDLAGVTVIGHVKRLTPEQVQRWHTQLENSGIGISRVPSPTWRAQIDRYDVIYKFMKKNHEGTREQDKVIVEVASWFIPVGWIGKLKYVKAAVNLFKLKRGIVVAEEGSNFLYHYTSKEAAASISQQGLKVGKDGFSYLTKEANLSGLQAQIELALPVNRSLPNAVIKINVSGMNPALIRRVTGNLPGYGAGGGTEFLFNDFIPANRITILP